MTKRKTRGGGNQVALTIIIVSILLGVIGWLLYSDSMISSLQTGVIVGAAVGAMMWPIVRDPAKSNLTVYGAAAGLLIMIFVELGRLLFQLQASGISFQNTAVLGAFAYAAVFRILYVSVGTAIIASFFASTENVLLGLVVGVCLGGAVAGIALPFLATQGIVFSLPITRVVLGFALALIFVGFINQ